jgi:hypothetical protein
VDFEPTDVIELADTLLRNADVRKERPKPEPELPAMGGDVGREE